MPPPSWRETVERWLPSGLFLLIPALLVLPGLQPGKFLFGMDVVGGFYHLRGAVGSALAQGRLPVWDPHTMCGGPLLASMHGGVLYPLTWPAALLDPGLFWTLTAWVHLSLSGAFAFAWLGRGLGLGRWSALGGALLFMLSGCPASHIYNGHIPHVSAFPWAAALMWRLERFLGGPTLGRGLFLAGALALMILAGFPQFVFIAGFAVLARLAHFVLADREGRKARVGIALQAAAAMGLAGALAAPQLLPAMELTGQAQRAAVGTYEFVTSFSLPPSSLVTVGAPMALGDFRTLDADSLLYLGMTGIGLAALGALGGARQSRLWLGVALLGIVLAMGQHTPVFRLFFHGVPGLSLFRVPARYLLLTALAAAPLAAMGIERLLKGDDSLRRHVAGVAAVAALLLAAALGAAAFTGGWFDRGLFWTALVLAALIGVLLAHRRSSLAGATAAAALGLLLVAELGGFNSPCFRGYPKEDMEWPAEFVGNVRNHPQHPFRIATVTMEQTPAIGKCRMAGIDHLGGYDPMMLRRYTELCNVARGKPIGEVIVAMAVAGPSPLFDLLGARYWIVPGQRQEPPGWKTIGQLPSGFVYENPRAMPRAFLVGRSIAIESSEARLKAMMDPSFDPRRVAIVDAASDASPAGPLEIQGSIQLASMSPGRYALRTDCSSDALLVLSEAFYPGWTAEVDGAPVPILAADHLLQAVRLPAGRHDVQFTYRSRYLRLGFALAAAGLLLPLALLYLRKRKA